MPTTPAAWSIAAAVGAWLGVASGLGSVVAASLIGVLALVAVTGHRWVWLGLAFSVMVVMELHKWIRARLSSAAMAQPR